MYISFVRFHLWTSLFLSFGEYRKLKEKDLEGVVCTLRQTRRCSSNLTVSSRLDSCVKKDEKDEEPLW